MTPGEYFTDSAPTDQSDSGYVIQLVDHILRAARTADASDVHLIPKADGLEMLWRIDGVLQSVVHFEQQFAPKVVSRLKVMSGLLTYRSDIPQEGRIAADVSGDETRVSTFPTLFGEKAVVRLFASRGSYDRIDQLGLPTGVKASLKQKLAQTSGVILLTGPAGSGKTTTIYACLREIVDESSAGRSLVSLEDPIEVIVPGVSQSQVNDSVGFTLNSGLRSLMRQDPEVIMVGEIRDRSTAETVFQASLTGHLVITTFHAASAAGAISRLLDMKIEPYLLRSSLQTIVSQRLVRKLCSCAETVKSDALPENSQASSAKAAVGCSNCSGTGYAGRLLLSEMIEPDDQTTATAILERQETSKIHDAAVKSGMTTLRQRAWTAVEDGQTSIEELYRVFGTIE